MLTVRYYGQLRELAGIDSEDVPLADAGAIYERLKDKYGFPLSQNHVRLAVNDEFVSWDHPLADGDLLVFIPPVAGG